MLERLNNLDNKDKGTLVCGGIILIVIIFVLVTGFNNEIIKNNDSVNNEEVNKLFDNIKDNYIMTINKNINNMNEEIIYYTDGKLELYESSIYEDGVIKYNNKLFCLNDESMELTDCDGEYDYVNDLFYDYSFIKSLLSECDYRRVSDNNVTCNVSLNNFFEKYNNMNNTEYVGDEREIVFDIVYNSSYISKISVDFSDVYNIIHGFDDKFSLNIKFNVNGNNFDKIYEYYKDILEA